MNEPAMLQPPSEMSLASVLALLWRRRWLFGVVAFVPVVLATLFLHVATYRYRADLSLSPPQSTVGGNLGGGLGGNLGALASIAGVGGVGGGGGLNFQLYREAVYERRTAEQLARRPGVLQGVFGREWDPASRSWRAPTGIVPGARQLLRTLIGAPDQGWQPPGPARLQEFIADEVGIASSSKSPVLRVSLNHPDPVFAARFLDELHAIVDHDLRQRLLARTDANIAYLSAKLDVVSIAEHRLALVQALSEQERLRMTANSTVAFAAEPFGPAAATRRPVEPNGLIVLAVGAAVGLALGFAAVLLAELRRPGAAPG